MYKKTVTKDDISKNMQAKLGFSAHICEEITSCVFNEIFQLAKRDGKIMLKNFGTWKINHKNARPGFNIIENHEVEISARSVLSFTPAGNLRKIVNDNISS